MVKCEGPGGAPGTTNPCPNTRLKVRSCQGDIWLCSKCEDKRFGAIDITDGSQDKDSILMTNAINHTTSVDNVEDQSENKIIINEVLTFITDKMNHLPNDAIVQLCTNFYSEDTLRNAQKILENRCKENSKRWKKRKGPSMKQYTVEDIIAYLETDHDLGVTFVAADLSLLPPIGFQNVDVCSLLSRLESNETEMKFLRNAVSIMEKNLYEQKSILEKITNDHLTNVNTNAAAIKENSELSKDNNVKITYSSVTSKNIPTNEISTESDEMERNTKDMNADKVQQQFFKNVNDFNRRNTITQSRSASTSRNKKFAITGCAKGLPIFANPRKRLANVFVSRLDPQTDVNTLKNYLDDKLKVNTKVELVNKTEWYASFHLTAHCDDPSSFMDTNVWPEGTLVRWWKTNKVTNSNINNNHD